MHTELNTLAAMDWQLLPIVGTAGGILIVIMVIIGKFFGEAQQTRQREESRREIAAYIAEGSMTQKEGVELLEAGEKKVGTRGG